MTTLNKPTGNYVSAADIVNQAYGSIGRSGIGSAANQIDQEGYDYWLNQLQSGAMFPDQFQRAFLNAAANYSGPNASAYQPSINAAKDLLKPPLPAGMYYDQNGNVAGGDLPNLPTGGYGVGSENMQTNGLLGLVNIPNVPLQSSPDNSNGIYATERDPSSPTRRDPWDYPTQLEPTGWYEPGGGGNPLGVAPLSRQTQTGYGTAVSAGPNYADIVNQAYQDLFGRAADPEGAKYWAGTGLTGDALKNAMIAGAQGADLQAYQKLAMAPQTPTTPIPFNPFDPVDPYVSDDFGNVLQTSTQPVSSRLNNLLGPRYTKSFADEQAEIAANQAAGIQTVGGITSLPAATTPTIPSQARIAYDPPNKAGGTGTAAFTNEQVAAYIRDQGLTDAQAQQAANALGVSSSQLAAAQALLKSGNLSGVDAASQAYAQQVAANPNIVSSNLSYYNPATNTGSAVEIANAYQQLFGRAPDTAGSQYWAGTGLTGQALLDAMVGGARGADIGAYYKTGDTDISGDITSGDIYNYVNQNINDPYAIFSAAEKYNVDPTTITKVLGWSPEDSAGFLNKYNAAKQIEQEYKDIGRGLSGDEAIDKEGFNYWYNQLQSGAITPEDFEKVFLGGAVESVKKGGIGEDVSAKTFVEALSKGYNVDNLASIVNPLEVYEEFREKKLTPEEVLKKNPQMNMADFENYFAQVPDLYSKNVDKTITDVLGANAVSAFTPEQKQTLVNNLVSGDATRENLAKSLQESGVNKQQEATRIANIYSQAYGMEPEDAKALFAKLSGADYKGTGVVSDSVYNEAKKTFDTSLKSETDANTGIASLIKKAAKQEGAENRKLFQDNPDLFLTYDDLEVRSNDPWAKYGEIHNAAIYDANAVDKYMEKIAGDGNLNSASNFAHRDTRRLGIDPGGIIDGGSAFIKRGADVLGLTKEKEYISGSEGEQIDTGKYVISGDINKAAQQAGIDSSKYQDKYKTETRTDPETGQEYKVQVLDKSANEQIYDAINEKYKDLYIIGNVNPDNDNDKSQNNFMYTPYRRTEDGKLIAIAEPTLYTGAINPDVYKKKGIFGGGFLGDFVQGIASIPLVAEIAAATIPGAAAYYPALKAAQTAAFTTDLGDIAKTGGIAALGQYGAQYVSPYISETLGTTPLATNLATGATLGAAGAGIMGQDIGKGALTGLVGAGLAYGTNQLLPEQGMKIASDLGIDPKYQSLFANTLARLGPTILTGGKIDPTKLLMSYAMNKAMKEGKEKMRTA